jgi:hypothetical protein
VNGPLNVHICEQTLYNSVRIKNEANLLLELAIKIARPKAAWSLAPIRDLSLEFPHTVELGAIRFQSELLTKNLSGLGRSFAFIATEGLELASWAGSLPPAKKPAAFLIRYLSLKQAEKKVEENLKELFGPLSLGAMSPGVLPQWPISAQEPFFELLKPLPL